MFAVSTSLKFLWKYFCIALARNAYYLVQLNRGTLIDGKTFMVRLKTEKTMKINLSTFTVLKRIIHISDISYVDTSIL